MVAVSTCRSTCVATSTWRHVGCAIVAGRAGRTRGAGLCRHVGVSTRRHCYVAFRGGGRQPIRATSARFVPPGCCRHGCIASHIPHDRRPLVEPAGVDPMTTRRHPDMTTDLRRRRRSDAPQAGRAGRDGEGADRAAPPTVRRRPVGQGHAYRALGRGRRTTSSTCRTVAVSTCRHRGHHAGGRQTPGGRREDAAGIIAVGIRKNSSHSRRHVDSSTYWTSGRVMRVSPMSDLALSHWEMVAGMAGVGGGCVRTSRCCDVAGRMRGALSPASLRSALARREARWRA